MAPTARTLARKTVRDGILAAARARLTDEGPTQLSLRAVARDVGMVSSAVYRYFPSRDDLLTALLVADYDELGDAVEAADAAAGPEVGARWVAVCRAIREWSIGHPGDFALLYGTPVPGYAAPQETIEPASRTTMALVRIVADAAERRDPGGSGAGRAAAGRRGSAVDGTADPEAVAPAVAGALGYLHEVGIDLPEELVVRVLMAWTTVFGAISFELFGHYVGSVTDHEGYFDLVTARLADDLGITGTR